MRLYSWIGWVVLMLFCSGAMAGAADAATPGSILQEGNAHYQSSDFVAAERAYRQVLDLGIDSSTVYYNLGNACFKQKKLGEAIYYWEKARRQQPGDPEIRENLELANLLVVDRIEMPEDPLPIRFLSRVVHFFTVAEETRIVLILFLTINALIAVYLLVRTPRLAMWALMTCIGVGAVMMLCTASMGWKIYQEGHDLQGVIVEPKAEIRSGPGAENITVVTIHEGVRVQIRGSSHGWYQVSLPNGWTGWLPAAALRVL